MGFALPPPVERPTKVPSLEDLKARAAPYILDYEFL